MRSECRCGDAALAELRSLDTCIMKMGSADAAACKLLQQQYAHCCGFAEKGDGIFIHKGEHLDGSHSLSYYIIAGGPCNMVYASTVLRQAAGGAGERASHHSPQSFPLSCVLKLLCCREHGGGTSYIYIYALGGIKYFIIQGVKEIWERSSPVFELLLGCIKMQGGK